MAMPAPYPAPAPGVCEICGSSPAIDVDLRQITGLVVVMRQTRRHCRLCHDCGIAVFRDVQSRTLLRGWWSVGSFFLFNWIAVIGNAGEYRRLARLADPHRSADSTGALQDTPLFPGTPLWRRPTSYAFLPLFALFMAIALGSVVVDEFHKRGPQPIDRSDPGASVGRCVQITGSTLDGTVDCSGDHSGVIDGTSPIFPDQCPHRADVIFVVGTVRRVCVDTSNHRP